MRSWLGLCGLCRSPAFRRTELFMEQELSGFAFCPFLPGPWAQPAPRVGRGCLYEKSSVFLGGACISCLDLKKTKNHPCVSYALLMDVEDLKDSMEMMLRWDFLTSEGLKDQLEPSLCLSWLLLTVVPCVWHWLVNPRTGTTCYTVIEFLLGFSAGNHILM